MSEITNPFFPEIVQVFEDLATQNDYEILLTSTVHDPSRMEHAIRRMIERRVDGVAVLTFGMEDAVLENLRFRKVPLVFIDVGPALPGISNIRIDSHHGIQQAVQHLAALRHVRIAFITGPLHLKTALARRIAFEQSMWEIRLDVASELIIEGDHTNQGGAHALELTSFKEVAPCASRKMLHLFCERQRAIPPLQVIDTVIRLRP